VTGRRAIDLTVPTATASAEGKGAIAILKVTDSRQFQNKPPSPSTPSIDGDVNAVPRDSLKGMIGRQRNGYGGAMGDVALAGDVNVETKVRELVSEGLRRRGYSSTPGGTDNVSVNIEEFWAWFSPGFATVSFESRIKCQVSLTKGGQAHQLAVNGYGINKGQIASDENWQLAYARAFDDFLVNLDKALVGAGL